MNNNNKPGFILLEILLALVILGTVFVVSIQAIASYIRTTTSARYLTTATILSQELLANINLNKFNSNSSKGKLDSDYPVYDWEINKTQIADSEYQYKAIIKWNEQGKEKDLTFITSRFEIEPHGQNP